MYTFYKNLSTMCILDPIFIARCSMIFANELPDMWTYDVPRNDNDVDYLYITWNVLVLLGDTALGHQILSVMSMQNKL